MFIKEVTDGFRYYYYYYYYYNHHCRQSRGDGDGYIDY